jgi:hypothetical protein
MIKQIKKSKFKKTVAIYLAMMILLETLQPIRMYALTSGPTQPEFNSFTPIGTSDMVDLASGDFNYNIPIMDVGGYPLNLAYNSGVTMDQEASWVGLGWNLNVGQIERQVRGLPDDFRGDELTYENNLKKNITVGVNIGINGAYTGSDALQLGVGLGVESNNYEGISFKPSYGIGFSFNKNVSVGMDFSSSLDGGATVSPRLGISTKLNDFEGTTTNLNSSISLGLNSRKGIENLNISACVSQAQKHTEHFKDKNGNDATKEVTDRTASGGSIGGSISFNNLSYTPSKRIGFRNENFSFNGALGGEAFGVEGQVQVTGYGSYQTIADEYRNRKEKGYGYENTEYKNGSGVLDFNRENERTITQNTLALPVTNYTYDTYSIDGQGVSGMFRPYRSKVSSLYNDDVVDYGTSNSFGVEVGLGNLFHSSADFKKAPSVSRTGGWIKNNNVLPYFNEKNTDKKSLTYEPITFKMVGATIVDPDSFYNSKIHESTALRIDIGGNNKNTYTLAYTLPDETKYGNEKIERTKRFLRSQVVQKVTKAEAARDKFVKINDSAKDHHTAAIKILQTDGSTYVYGEAAYNTKKIEATFDVSGYVGDNATGIVSYSGSVYGNGNGTTSDEYVNRVTTPAYAHSYLLSTVLSSDYQDIDNNGPTLNDLGSFTKFEYKNFSGYKWRVPFGLKTATYNEGLISKKDDQKGNYLYGEKELKYLDKIVTKTHVAFFDLEARKDAIGVAGEQGGSGSGRMQKLKSIRLYSRPEVTDATGAIFDPSKINNSTIKPIKTAHFVYSYSLCKGMINNDKSTNLTLNELSNYSGKLTLKKVYFTYRGSNMGKYTPYVFDYGENDSAYANLPKTTDIPYPDVPGALNPLYNMKGFDIWGNFKENLPNSGNVNSTNLSNTEFPFVEQNKTQADLNTASWNLKSVQLPSGGKITIETESDDYQFVQDKKAMQMYKVVGVGNDPVAPVDLQNKNILYNGNNHNKFLYIKLSDDDLTTGTNILTSQLFINKYLSENLNKPIQFKFMLNMSDNAAQYEYVGGYFKIDNKQQIGINYNTTLKATIASIPVEFLAKDKEANIANPIAKAGWGFGRTFLNRLTCGINDDPAATDFASIVENLKGSIRIIKEIFTGPDGYLQNKGRARIFKPEKSWVRLENSDGHKLGGGLRVKSIKLSDNWTQMLEGVQGTSTSDMEYGQSYSYNDIYGNSSGVATFEPNMCAENPFVEPFYNAKGNYAETVASPMESNYVEKPFGANFFPSSRITYARVAVKNLDRKDKEGSDGIIIVKKHATGSVVTQHYTSHDFPTKVNFTNLEMINGITPTIIIRNMLANIIVKGNIDVRNLLTMSQGYSIETNDMNGKIKLQEVYNEAKERISSVEYKYNIDEQGNIDNNINTLDEKGKVAKRIIGVDYDLINDFNQSYAETKTNGFKANLASFLIPSIPPFPLFIPSVFPESSTNVNELRTAVTVKHIHKTAIQVEKIATDLGATVSTKNLVWDANSGEVLLTETVNEYSDHYYSFNYPAYWMYDGMGMASQNIGIEGRLIANAPITGPNTSSSTSNNPYFKLENYSGEVSKIFHVGDELLVVDEGGIVQSSETLGVNLDAQYKLWVVGFNADKSGVLLMDRNGIYINKCEDLNSFEFKIVRSGYKNMQSATMASVTSMINPIKNGKLDQNSFLFNSNSSFNPRIINASAVVYKDYWNTQLESSLPYFPAYDSSKVLSQIDPVTGNTVIQDTNWILPSGDVKYPNDVKVNPYLWNIKGNWRAEKSYAYLTGRNSSEVQNNPRNEGFFTSFNPFYKIDNSTGVPVWKTDDNNWTSASSVTQYNPYGIELENKDALERYSAAQYGYVYKFPMAVASNAKYSQIGYEGFEEKKSSAIDKHFGFFVNPADISAAQSHTGKNSLKVNKGNTVTLNRNLKSQPKTISKAKCSNLPPIDVGTCKSLLRFEYKGSGDFVMKYKLCGNDFYTQHTFKGLLGNGGMTTYHNIDIDLDFPNGLCIVENSAVHVSGLSPVFAPEYSATTCVSLLSSICYDVVGFWPGPDPAHPGGGSIDYFDEFGEHQHLDGIWDNMSTQITASVIEPGAAKGVAINPCNGSKVWYFSSLGRTSSGLACNEIAFPLTLYTVGNVIALDLGVQLYTNPNLTIKVGSGNLWYQLGIEGISYRIDNNGIIAEVVNCSPP